jgi:hypothetical protein
MTEAGLPVHHCMPQDPLYRSAACACCGPRRTGCRPRGRPG